MRLSLISTFSYATADIHVYSLALYGLLLFYGLVHQELEGRRPLAKFLAIKLIVMATFYQSFIVRDPFASLIVSRANVGIRFSSTRLKDE